MLSQRTPIAPLTFLDITPADAQDQSNYTEHYQTFVRPTLEYVSIIWDPGIIYKFANENRIPFSFSDLRTKNEFVFKSKVRKTNSFFVFAFRKLRPHCYFGWRVKVGSFSGILWSHWWRFENKLAEIASAMGV